MNRLQIANYNLDTTLLGGQAFNWDKFGNVYYGFTSDKIIKIKKESDSSILWQTYPDKDNIDFLVNYLNLNSNYDNELTKISVDNHIKNAISKYSGLRLLNQDFYQTTLSFILSSNKNIQSIRQSVRLLSKNLGKPIKFDGKTFYTFPEAQAISESSIETLLDTKIGYRAKYLKESASKILNMSKVDFEGIHSNNIREKLVTLSGVGNKVADCIMVFSLGVKDVTPLDVWAKRVLIDLYNHPDNFNYIQMQEWLNDYFKGNPALAGQFLFEYIRNSHGL